MELRFFPVGGFSGTPTDCPQSGSDKGCQGDKYEACLLHTACGGISCPAAEQLKLASFLECFEGQNASAMDAAEPCAAKAGFDVSAVRACDRSPVQAAAAFAAVQAAASKGKKGMKCFPWIVIDGTVESKDPTEGCFGKDPSTAPLLPLLCHAIEASGTAPPAGCGSP